MREEVGGGRGEKKDLGKLETKPKSLETGGILLEKGNSGGQRKNPN